MLGAKVLALESLRLEREPQPLYPFPVGRALRARVLVDHRTGDRLHQRLRGRAATQGLADPAAAIHGDRADRLVLAAEVVTEGPGRYAGLCGDVVDEHVLQAALGRQVHGSHAQRAARGSLLALSKPFGFAQLTAGEVGEFAG